MASYWIYKILHGVNEDALCHEFYLRGLRFVRQQGVPIPYKGIKLGTDLRLNLSRKGFFELVEDKVIVDLKAKEKLSPIDNLDKPKFQINNNPRLPKSLPVRGPHADRKWRAGLRSLRLCVKY